MISEEYSTNNHDNQKISGIAKQRWKLLAQILQNGSRKSDKNIKNTVSIRRFNSFGLFNVKTIAENKHLLWQEFQLKHSTSFTLAVSQLCGNIQADKLQGFNNTGNICIWPAEEIMAYYCLVNNHLFQNKSIIEIGGGMTCLAGFSLAVGTEADIVHLTDGNEDSVKNLSVMVEKNQNNFGNTQVSSSLFRWGPGKLEDSLQEKFDIVLCADCLFFEEGRKDLIHSMYNLLKSQGEVFVFAPCRGETFSIFIELAQELFDTQVIDDYNITVSKLHTQFKEDCLYDENIHYPLLLKMVKN